jgi:ParB family chromosome partitioning protein
MNLVPDSIEMIPISTIHVLNPRARNKRVFGELVTSIANLGLKKPITVAVRNGGSSYELVCGQGRLEAFIALEQTEIPAVIIEASKDDCYVKSLVENLARRQHSSLELVREIGSLRERGYSTGEIAEKIDFSPEYVYAICYLLDHGEQRLLAAVEKGTIPHSIAMEIVRAKDSEVQQALAEAYEAGSLPGKQVLAIRRIIDCRKTTGKGMTSAHRGARGAGKKITAEALIRTYRKEADRQRILVRKAGLANSRLLFIVNALRKLLSDKAFVQLLRDEKLYSLPKPLVERLQIDGVGS